MPKSSYGAKWNISVWGSGCKNIIHRGQYFISFMLESCKKMNEKFRIFFGTKSEQNLIKTWGEFLNQFLSIYHNSWTFIIHFLRSIIVIQMSDVRSISFNFAFFFGSHPSAQWITFLQGQNEYFLLKKKRVGLFLCIR